MSVQKICILTNKPLKTELFGAMTARLSHKVSASVFLKRKAKKQTENITDVFRVKTRFSNFTGVG